MKPTGSAAALAAIAFAVLGILCAVPCGAADASPGIAAVPPNPALECSLADQAPPLDCSGRGPERTAQVSVAQRGARTGHPTSPEISDASAALLEDLLQKGPETRRVGP